MNLHATKHVSWDAAVGRIEECFRGHNTDYMYRDPYTTVKIDGPNSRFYLLRYGVPDGRRSLDPLDLSETSVKCFCHWTAECPHVEYNDCFPISNSSSIFLRNDRVHQYANECGPEPLEEHYVEMVELAGRIQCPTMTVVNLASSGASVPQHFHTQIYKLGEIAGAPKNSIRELWKNIEISEPGVVVDDIELLEVTHPVWGMRFRFGERFNSRQIGEMLFRSLHRDLRYASQLALTYNLFIESPRFREVTVLFRESRTERMFQLEACHDVMRQFATTACANRVARSPNRLWRWAWLELIGGFPARDDSFAKTHVFNFRFWAELLSLAGLERGLSRKVFDRIQTSLSEYCAGLLSPGLSPKR